MATAKTKLINGVRINIESGQPDFQNTKSQRDALDLRQSPEKLPLTSAGNVKPITVNQLTSTETPINVPPPTVSTGMAGLQGFIQQGTDQFTQDQQVKAKKAEADKKNSQNDFLSSVLNAPTQSGLESQAYKTEVDPIQKELDSIQKQIRQEQRDLENQTRDIQDAGGGLVSGQNIDLQKIRGESIRRQADLYIIQEGIQGRFDSAKAIADRAIKAQMEQSRKEQEVRQFIYEENKESFTTAEQRAFESAQGDRERALDKEEADRTALYNLAIEAKKNGASNATMQSILNSKSPTEALTVGGNYLVKPTAASAPKLQNFGNSDNPVWRQYNYQTGQWEEVSGLGVSSMSPAQVMEIDKGIQESQVALNIVDNLLDNKRGVGAITGQFKTPTVSGFFQGGKAEGKIGTLTRFLPVIGNVQGAIQSRNDRDNALTDLTYIYNTEGFQEFIGLKQSGLTFGSLTAGERGAIFAAANRLNSAITLQEGGDSSVVTGYRGTDENLIADLQLVAKGLKAGQDELNAQLMMNNNDKREIINI